LPDSEHRYPPESSLSAPDFRPKRNATPASKTQAPFTNIFLLIAVTLPKKQTPTTHHYKSPPSKNTTMSFDLQTISGQ
jgi:hypothetical protein